MKQYGTEQDLIFFRWDEFY